jgi:hypothetical protein
LRKGGNKMLKKCVLGIILSTSILLSAPTVDGVIDPSEGWILVATSANPNGGGDGANLNNFYYYFDTNDLYLAINTFNSASWDVAYGFSLDMDSVEFSGYYTGDNDAWGRRMNFAGWAPYNYALEYEIYFWWSGWDGAITAWNLCTWNGTGWDYWGVAEFAWTGDNSTGLQALEIRIPWTDLGGFDPTFHTSAWVTGGGGSSAVDIIPPDFQVADGGGAEWTDSDTISTFGGPTSVEEKGEAVSSILRTRYEGGNVVFSIQLDNPTMVNLEIYDVTGRIVSTPISGILSGTKTVMVNLPSSGIYIYRLTTGERVEKGKFIVMK